MANFRSETGLRGRGRSPESSDGRNILGAGAGAPLLPSALDQGMGEMQRLRAYAR